MTTTTTATTTTTTATAATTITIVVAAVAVDVFVVAEVAAVVIVVAAVAVVVVVVAVVVVVMGLSGWRWQHGLVKQVSQTHSSQHSSGDAEHAGGVAAVVMAGADLSVVLLQHGGVAVTALGVRLIPAAPDDPLVTAHVLVDFPAEVFIAICGALGQELLCLLLIRCVFEVEGVAAVEVVV